MNTCTSNEVNPMSSLNPSVVTKWIDAKIACDFHFQLVSMQGNQSKVLEYVIR